MKTLTKKQRQKVYLKAAKIFANGENYVWSDRCGNDVRIGMCCVFKFLLKVDMYELEEVLLFDPGYAFWFSYDREGDNCRVYLLLLCAEMCNQ